MADPEPAYLALHRSGELLARAEAAQSLLTKPCRVCPKLCPVDRLAGTFGRCRIGRQALVSSYGPHHGEEDCLRGWGGSGTIFFAGCNLRCVFCQNCDISCQVEGEPVTAGQLARMMVSLQARGCHNINWVTPEHVVPQILEALPLAVEAGLRLPIVYNTSAYDGLESLHLLDGVVDVYMPDFKFWTPQRAKRYMLTPDYPEVARAALREMHRQVGDLMIDGRGLARRGVLVRHLVMPGLLDETAAILRFLAEELGLDTYVNLMPQYFPAGRVGRHYPELNRRLFPAEFAEALTIAGRLELRRLDGRAR